MTGPRRSAAEQSTAMEMCRDGLGGGAALDKGEWVDQFARACSGLFADAECRQAWAQVPEREPAAKMTSVIEPCRLAYCPALPEPRPALCSVEGVVPPAQHGLWPAFARAVLARDLGMSETQVDAFVAALPRPSASLPTTPNADAEAQSEARHEVVRADSDPTTTRLEIGRAGADVTIRTRDAFLMFDAQAHDEVKAWVQAHTPTGGDLVLVVDPALDFAVVRMVMEAAEERGLRVRVSSAASPE